MKNAHHNLPDAKFSKSLQKGLFCRINSSKPKLSLFTIINDRKAANPYI